MKSTTCPTAKPGSRNSRSVRLPSTPPSSSPSTTAQRRERTRVAASHTITTGHHGEGDREDPGDALAEREGGTGISDEVEDQEVAEHLHGLLGRQILDREVLGELIGGQHQHRENRDDGAGRRLMQGGSACQRPA